MLCWAVVAFFTVQLVLVVLHEERPVSRTVSIAPLDTTDGAVQRQSVD
ncbi:MAG: hypothetical protein GYB36_03350 [Alphaproteobacteria bacterium]|nr:hypothetical protein [Alphaproteobacteria bacterium]